VGTGDYETKMLNILGFEGYGENATDLSIDVKFGTISEGVENLESDTKESYLKLMYGKYFEGTYDCLTRTKLSDGVTEVPSKKLVFIASRLNSYPALATNAAYGIGGASSVDDVPDNYEDLAAKYKTKLLFGTADDYEMFISQINNNENYVTAPTNEQKDQIKVNAFNYYINYMFTLKYTYELYGANFDIILKGHPRETMNEMSSWSSHYVLGDSYNYDLLINNLMVAFHSLDSVGKYIGMVPYGTAAENLAYLGADISLCGLPSSTYTGYDTAVDIKFILSLTNSAINSDTNLNGRYEAGTLLDHDESGNENITDFHNLGLIYKNLVAIYTEASDMSNASTYQTLFENWLRTQAGLDAGADLSGYDVDQQGFLVAPEE
ncbi:MAG: hypothetical protein IJX05_00770, partial [Clostridia bacterium]|nr:hypothetical protein [Clostridia bacterium]